MATKKVEKNQEETKVEETKGRKIVPHGTKSKYKGFVFVQPTKAQRDTLTKEEIKALNAVDKIETVKWKDGEFNSMKFSISTKTKEGDRGYSPAIQVTGNKIKQVLEKQNSLVEVIVQSEVKTHKVHGKYNVHKLLAIKEVYDFDNVIEGEYNITENNTASVDDNDLPF